MNPEANHQLLDRAAATADNATAQALGAAQRGVSALRDGSHQLLDRAQHANDSTVAYVRSQPMKALLIAAGAGAALMAVASFLARHPRSHD
jgi:ElaB/YqjD/DUF883 family membrane-anchored ribosome-binding protein